MYPMNRFMDSHPYQRNQVPYSHHYYPHFESNPHHMNIDPTRSTLAYESWPCGGSYGHPYPPQCHSCCIHTNSPSQCAFRPSYPYLPPTTYNNCSYPAYPMVYPAHYVPPPHFNIEQPRYEYEKNIDRDHHCCGCPNHPCSIKKGGSNVKIEEHDQDKRNESNESLVPLGFKNCSYPVVWLSPDDMKNKERVKPNGSNCKEQDDDLQVVKPYENLRPFQQPNVWNVWPPHQGNNSESPKQRADLPGKQQHDDVNMNQLPFPIIWMPYKPEEEGEKVSKETESGLIPKGEPTSSNLTKPMLRDFENKRSNSKENEVKGGSEIRGKELKKEAVVRTIPVKQVEQHEKVLEGKKEDVSQRHESDAKEKKITQDGDKKQNSSLTKSSKLPPVCLRVDPLPRKKNSNGSSRSPSPPGGKGKLVESHNDRSKPPILSSVENVQLDKSSTTSMSGKSIEVDPSKNKAKVIEVAQGMTKEDELQDKRTIFLDLKRQARSQAGEVDTSKAANEPKDQPDRVAAKAHFSNEGHQRGEAREEVNGKVDAGNEMEREKRSKPSDDKAATIIQSAYRGFNVRKWEPLKKLKQIAKIKEQMVELENRIQALESSADKEDNKQRIIITETIMGLLLKLDTIQGLHPTIREHRKSVAKELVSLQEKLDLLYCKKQQAESEQTLAAKPTDVTRATMEDDISLQEGLEVQKLELHDDLAKGDEGMKVDAKELSEEQPLCVTEMPAESHDVGNAGLVRKEENKGVEKVMENFLGDNAVVTGDGASETPFESKDKTDDKLLDKKATVVEKLEEHGEAKQSVPNSIPSSEELANSGPEIKVCGFKEKGDVVDELEELPRGVPDEVTNVQEIAEIIKDEVLQYDKGDLTTHIPEKKDSDTESLEHHYLEALGETPVILLEDTLSNNRAEERAEVLERDAAVLIDIPKQEEEDARLLNEYTNISDIDDKVGMEKNDKELEQDGTASYGFSQSQEDTITTEQPTEAVEVLQEKMQYAVDRDIEILDSGKTMEQLAEPQLSSVTNDEAQEYHIQDKQKIEKENMEVQGDELPARSGVITSVPDNEGKEHNVDVLQRHVEQNFEMQGKEPVATDSGAPVTEEPVDASKAMAAPTSEAATTETELSGENELGVAEDHNTCNATEGNSDDAAQSLGSMPIEVKVIDTNELKECKKADISPSSPTASQVSCDSDAPSESDRKLIEENEKLREMMEKLIKSGKEQLTAISSLSGRVKDLEKKLSRKKKLKLKRDRMPTTGSVCVKPSNDSLRNRVMGLAI